MWWHEYKRALGHSKRISVMAWTNILCRLLLRRLRAHHQRGKNCARWKYQNSFSPPHLGRYIHTRHEYSCVHSHTYIYADWWLIRESLPPPPRDWLDWSSVDLLMTGLSDWLIDWKSENMEENQPMTITNWYCGREKWGENRSVKIIALRGAISSRLLLPPYISLLWEQFFCST